MGGPDARPLRQRRRSPAPSRRGPQHAARPSSPFPRSRGSRPASCSRHPAWTATSRSTSRVPSSFTSAALSELVSRCPRASPSSGGAGGRSCTPRSTWAPDRCAATERPSREAIRARAGSTEVFGDVDCVVRARRAGGATDLSGSTLFDHPRRHRKGAAARGRLVGERSRCRRRRCGRPGACASTRRRTSRRRTRPPRRSSSRRTRASRPGPPTSFGCRSSTRTRRCGWPLRRSRCARSSRTEGAPRFERSTRSATGRQDGAVLMDLGWIDLGYDLTDGATGLVLVGPEAWYGAQDGDACATQLARPGARPRRRSRPLGTPRLTPVLRKEEAKALAARCALEVRSCDGAAFEGLLRTAADARRARHPERDHLRADGRRGGEGGQGRRDARPAGRGQPWRRP